MILLKRKGDTLSPVYESDLKAILKHKEDEPFWVTDKKARNYEFHKKCFALFNLGHENTSKLDHLPFDAYRKLITMRAGYFNVYHTDKGDFYEPHSLAFDKMDADTFDECYRKVLQQIINDIGSTSKEIEEELINFM